MKYAGLRERLNREDEPASRRFALSVYRKRKGCGALSIRIEHPAILND
ncbi:MAG: hypothetical protein LBB61_10600 [Treponema sp.]|nr:hypothetical protein [Treponema sp.]